MSLMLTNIAFGSSLPSTHKVRLRHPGYPSTRDTLFSFKAYDHQDGGIKRFAAITACALVAGNAWRGYMSRDRTGPPVLDEILVGESFFFHHHVHGVSDSPDSCFGIIQPYPVYPDFLSWPFPHNHLPPWWPTLGPAPAPAVKLSDISMAIKARDQSCRVTGFTEAGETAHLIAVKLQEWFMDQGMYNYSDDDESIDSTGNQLLLRVDVHRAYDQCKWVIFPSADRYVYHALDSYELASLYHQRELRPIYGVRPEYILAAFARAIFPKLRRFLGTRMDKYLLLVEEGSETPQR